MDTLAALGRGIPEQVPQTYQVYGKFLREPDVLAENRKVQRQTFSYGSHHRQKLDLYSPTAEAPKPALGEERPVVIFAYGGAFISGDRVLETIPDGVAYSNVGQFFASKLGFETIVMDYRLLRHGATYPSGGEDVNGVLSWVEGRYQDKGPRDVYLIGNSAGGVHVATWLFEKKFVAHRARFIGGVGGLTVSKVVVLGCPLRHEFHGGMKDMLKAYYGGEKETLEAEPTVMMLKATKGIPPEKMFDQPSILAAVSELDPESIIEHGQEFEKLWRERGGKGNFFMVKGHNHISPPLSLGTGLAQEEDWGYAVGRWLKTGRL